MAKAKWFEDLNASTPTHEAARLVLTERLECVRDRLARVAEHSGDDPEPVHQLRVASRRLAAAVSIFGDYLEHRLWRKLRRDARRLRRAAGRVRDLDVQSEMMDRRLEADGQSATPEAAALRAEFARRRGKGYRKLKRILPRWQERLERRAKDMQADQAVQPLERGRSVETLALTAGRVLEKRLAQFRTAGAADMNDMDRLHELRIAGKRLRYSMEVFAACYPAAFRDELYAQVEAVQSELGDINDVRTLANTLSRMDRLDVDGCGADDIRAAIDWFGETLGSELAELQQTFVRQWRAGRTDFEQSFVRLLAS